jgi:hypothetical protein
LVMSLPTVGHKGGHAVPALETICNARPGDPVAIRSNSLTNRSRKTVTARR